MVIYGVAAMAMPIIRHHAGRVAPWRLRRRCRPYVPVRQAPEPLWGVAGGNDLVTQLAQLGELHSSGVLSDEEFIAAEVGVVENEDLEGPPSSAVPSDLGSARAERSGGIHPYGNPTKVRESVAGSRCVAWKPPAQVGWSPLEWCP